MNIVLFRLLKKLFIIISVSLPILLIYGCASVTDSIPDEEILNITGNIYEIIDVDKRGIFGSESSLIDGVVTQVDDFAETKDKIASPLEARIHRVGILGDWAWFYYKFMLVDKNTPEAYKKLTDVTIERDARLSAEFYINRHKREIISVADEIVKLDELRKRGLLNDSEFEKLKIQLLEK